MHDPGLTAPSFPLPGPGRPKGPLLGIASLVAALVEIMSACALFLFAYYLGNQSEFLSPADVQRISPVGLVFIVLTAIAGLTGIGLGIVAVFRKGAGRLFGIAGLALAGLTTAIFCLFMLAMVFFVVTALIAP